MLLAENPTLVNPTVRFLLIILLTARQTEAQYTGAGPQRAAHFSNIGGVFGPEAV
jgi:hypothetical protein